MRAARASAGATTVVATVTLCAGVMVSVTALGAPAGAAPRGELNGRLAFDSDRAGDGRRDIWAMAPSQGAEPVPLTTGPGSNTDPAWSAPDCTSILESQSPPPLVAFVHTDGSAGATPKIHVVRVGDGLPAGPGEPLTAGTAAETAPAWSPNWIPGMPEGGPRAGYTPLAFERRGSDGTRDIWVSTPDGTTVSNVTRTPGVDEANPEWSTGPGPVVSDAWLAWDMEHEGRRALVVADVSFANGSFRAAEPRVLTRGQAASADPTWFTYTDGGAGFLDVLAFSGLDDDGRQRLHALEYERLRPGGARTDPFEDVGASVALQLSDAGEQRAPTWSPVGNLLAYEGPAERGSDIFTLDPGADRDDVTNVTNSPGADDRNPDWEAPQAKCDDAFPVRPRGRRARLRPRVRLASEPDSTPAPAPSPESSPASPGEAPTSGSVPPAGPPSAPATRRAPRGATRPACTRTGSHRGELIRGTSKRDVICGGGGNDRIVGLGGDDVIRGGSGDDRIQARAGNDTVEAGPGNDRIDGGPGTDVLDGGPGRDRIAARDGRRDRVVGGAGRDRASVDRRDRVSGVEAVRRR